MKGVVKIGSRMQVVNPWRADCEFQPRSEALFGLSGKVACHLCGTEELEQLSSLSTSCAHAACSVCYTITHRDKFEEKGCPSRCGGTGGITRTLRNAQMEIKQFVDASLFDEE